MIQDLIPQAHDTHCIRLLEEVNLSRQNLRNVEGLSLIREKEEGKMVSLPPFYPYFDVPQRTVNMP